MPAFRAHVCVHTRPAPSPPEARHSWFRPRKPSKKKERERENRERKRVPLSLERARARAEGPRGAVEVEGSAASERDVGRKREGELDEPCAADCGVNED